jgi:hypothetical protein
MAEAERRAAVVEAQAEGTERPARGGAPSGAPAVADLPAREGAPAAAAAPKTILDLPYEVLALILERLVGLSARRSPRDAVRLAFASRQLYTIQAEAPPIAPFWAAQCARMAWPLDWVAAEGPAGAECRAFAYFCARSAARWRLRRALKAYRAYMPRLDAAALRPPAAPGEVARVEENLQLHLPWELFELARWADGQEALSRGGANFLNDTRLLPIAEAGRAAHGVGAAGKAARAAEWAAARAAATARLGPGGAAAAAAEAAAEARAALAGGRRRPESPVLFPFTGQVWGTRAYAVDLAGRVWLQVGGGEHRFAAGSIAQLLERALA